MAFNSFRSVIQSIDENGKFWQSSFRKVVSNATAAGTWCDLSYSPGNPPANFYATEPLVSAVLSGSRGIDNGGSVSPDTKILQKLLIYSATTSVQSSKFMLCDYLLYYPFIDGDSTEEQVLTNSVSLPRFTNGQGVRAILVSQGSYSGNANFTMSYTNQDGTPGRVTPVVRTNTAGFAATLIHAGTHVGSSGPFIPLQSGDYGIRSVESITFSSANGGIASLVLVKPITEIGIAEVTATFATPSQVENFYDFNSGTQIQDGAYLNFLCLPNGSISGAVISGLLKTMWG